MKINSKLSRPNGRYYGRRWALLTPLALVGIYAGCGGGSGSGGTATPTATPAAGATDITNALLTSRSANCADYVKSYAATAKDVQNNTTFAASLVVSSGGSGCTFASNAIPNHDFNATGNFATRVSAQTQSYTIPANPTRAATTTPISLQYDNAVLLNGVKVDLLAAGCFGVGNGNVGCNALDTPYRYDAGVEGGFGTDEHHAHTQPNGTYHYHGNPKALFNETNPTAPSPVIGFAADGFPIFGSYFRDSSGTLRKATSSYRLKSGTRSGGPGGSYDGTFIDDYQYSAGAGDLDECNGMTVDGVYGYFITDGYPYVIGCFRGTPDDSFRKSGNFPTTNNSGGPPA